jgi:hypothetical protein
MSIEKCMQTTPVTMVTECGLRKKSLIVIDHHPQKAFAGLSPRRNSLIEVPVVTTKRSALLSPISAAAVHVSSKKIFSSPSVNILAALDT